MKRIFYCLVLVSIFTSNVYAQSTTTHGKNSDVWSVIKYPSSNFPIQYTHNECSVSVRNDGRVVWITAHDLSWHGNYLNQHNVLEKGTDGIFRNNIYYRETSINNHPLNLTPEAREALHYDIFSSKCLKATRGLPIEVQKAFRGLYGLGLSE